MLRLLTLVKSSFDVEAVSDVELLSSFALLENLAVLFDFDLVEDCIPPLECEVPADFMTVVIINGSSLHPNAFA
jgi:hypothetical protein